eukprot:2532016-Pyramimonas_sp.AAC.4
MDFRGFLGGLALIAADKKMGFQEVSDMVLRAASRKVAATADMASPPASTVASSLMPSTILGASSSPPQPPPGNRPVVLSNGSSYGGTNLANYGGPSAGYTSAQGSNLGGKTATAEKAGKVRRAPSIAPSTPAPGITSFLVDSLVRWFVIDSRWLLVVICVPKL